MNQVEYEKDFCQRCHKCDGSEYHRYHCTDTDILEEAWEACEQHMIDKSCFAYCYQCNLIYNMQFGKDCPTERKLCARLNAFRKALEEMEK